MVILEDIKIQRIYIRTDVREREKPVRFGAHGDSKTRKSESRRVPPLLLLLSRLATSAKRFCQNSSLSFSAILF